jgi:very-short-patch-repair endonuclease
VILCDIWKRDTSRLDFLNRSGYSTLVVWEDEWKNNRELVIEKCKKFILDEKT